MQPLYTILLFFLSITGLNHLAVASADDDCLTPRQATEVPPASFSRAPFAAKPEFSFQDGTNQLEIFYAGKRIATYLKSHPHLSRRALVNVHSLHGNQVTRNFPARAPQDIDPGHPDKQRIIHPYMHPGIWVSYGDLSGNDYWRLQAKVKFDSWMNRPTAKNQAGTFSAKNLFLSQNGKTVVCQELSHYRFKIIDAGLLLLIDVEYKSDQNDFYFGDQEESGLAIRVASPIRVVGGNGTILNQQGERNGKSIWGKNSGWFDYSGTIHDRQVGIMVAANPENFRPSWLHARDYGLVATNPFPKQPRERREPYRKTPVKKGETLTLSWALLVHDHPRDQLLDRKAIYNQLLKQWAR
ncbi:MAG: DUF6807 family protein [Planctomycetota bacterium]|nr:DUF6807 family protein [Planctomycetota bacterium]